MVKGHRGPLWRGVLLLVAGSALVAGCGASNTGTLTGRIGFSGRVPPVALLSRNGVVVLRSDIVVETEPFVPGQPYSFSLAPGNYTIHLRGPDNGRWDAVAKVSAGHTTHLNLTFVVFGHADTKR
jgi:hypothetical protein